MVPPPPALALLMAAIRPAVPPVGPKQGTLIMGAAEATATGPVVRASTPALVAHTDRTTVASFMIYPLMVAYFGSKLRPNVRTVNGAGEDGTYAHPHRRS